MHKMERVGGIRIRILTRKLGIDSKVLLPPSLRREEEETIGSAVYFPVSYLIAYALLLKYLEHYRRLTVAVVER